MWWLDPEVFKQEDKDKKRNQGCPAMGVPADEDKKKEGRKDDKN